MQDKKNSLSTLLAEAMKNSGISVEKLSRETGVSERVMSLLLEDDFSNLPPTPYLHGYVVKIFEHFNIDGEKVWGTYFKGSEFLRQSGKDDRLPENRFLVSSINKKLVLIVLIIILIPTYFIVSSINSKNLSRHLSLDNIQDEIVMTATSTFLVEGEIKNNLGLVINDIRVTPDSDGKFQTNIGLSPGFNTVTFVIEGSLGNKEVVIRQIFYEEESDTLEEEPPFSNFEEEPSFNDFEEESSFNNFGE